MIVDVHSHCHQPEHWGREHEDHWQAAYGGEPEPVVTPDADVQVEQEAGGDVALVVRRAAAQAGLPPPDPFLPGFLPPEVTPAIPLWPDGPLEADWRDQLDE